MLKCSKYNFNEELQKNGLNFIVESYERNSKYVIKYVLKSPILSKVRHRIEVVDTKLGYKQAILALKKALLSNTKNFQQNIQDES